MTNRELINELKADFRAYMNGVASAAMRNAGMTADYRVNFGVELPRITDVKNELEVPYHRPHALPETAHGHRSG